MTNPVKEEGDGRSEFADRLANHMFRLSADVVKG
jgi:hypothetical protein